MASFKPLSLPAQKNAPLDANGNFASLWYLFWNAATVMLNAVAVNADDLATTVASLVSGAKAAIVQQKTQAQLAALAATLTVNDNGLLVEVTDFGHILRWTNPAWDWGPGELGSGYFAPFAVAPTGVGWQVCDGSAGVAYLKADGTTGTVTLPNTVATAAYLKAGGAYSPTITAAAVPVISTPTITVSNTTLAQGGFTVAAGPVALDTQAVHNHAGASSTPTATLPGDPVDFFRAVLWFRI